MADTNPQSDLAAEDARKLQAKGGEDLVQSWLKELNQAFKREKDWRKAAGDCVHLYEAGGSTGKTSPYNILFSNTETLSPALYNNPPRPVVKPRFVQKDNALSRLSALTGQRLLQFLIDTNSPESPDLDEVVKQVVTEALVPGRGIPRVKYDASFALEGEVEKVETEEVCFEVVPWDQFLHGYAKHWEQVPWVAFEHRMSLEEAKESFGEATARKLQFTEADSAEGEDETGGKGGLFGRKQANSQGAQLAQVFEIWNRADKRVLFISPNLRTEPVKVVDDPLKLQGFFPCPKPLQLVRKITSLTPQTLYAMYEQQAVELNDLTTRITRIVRALKVRGYYNSTVEGLRNLLEAEDNTMLPITNAGQLQAQGLRLDDAIWLFPIERLVAVLQQLVAQRAQVKQVIFEITGIADIMRGSSQASETLGAQEIKNQWGTLRLKRLQKEVTRFIRDTLRIALEVMVTQFDAATVKAMTGLPFPLREEKLQAQAQLQQLQAVTPPGAEPPPELQQLAAVAQAPDMDTILEMLRDDTMRNFVIDIETNSTVDAEATEDKQDMAELMNALAQFLNGVTPLVESGAMPFDAAKVIMLNLLRRFRMGGEIEEAIMAMQPPSAGGEGEKAQLEQMQKALAGEKQALEQAKADLAAQQQEFNLAKSAAERELQMKESFSLRKIQQEQQFAVRTLEQEKQLAEQSLQQSARLQQQQVQAAAASSQEGA